MNGDADPDVQSWQDRMLAGSAPRFAESPLTRVWARSDETNAGTDAVEAIERLRADRRAESGEDARKSRKLRKR
jgi:hypothetical protein